VPVENPTLIGLDIALTAFIVIIRMRRKILTCTETRIQQEKSLSDYAL
jgi:hypothetical protein